MPARQAHQSQQAFKAGRKWPWDVLASMGQAYICASADIRRTVPPLWSRSGLDHLLGHFLQVFWIFGIARRRELEWLCPSCQTIGTDNASETRSFVSAHGSPLLWRDRVRLPIFAVAVLLAGWAGTRGFDGAIWVVLAAIILALTIGARHNLRP